MAVNKYVPPFDARTIPDEVIDLEYAARRALRKRKLEKKYGRAALIVKERTCKGCNQTGSTTWLRQHKCVIAWPARY